MADNSCVRDQFASRYHRIAGAYTLLCDIDLVDTENAFADGIWVEYMNNYGKNRIVAFSDYKRVVKNKTTVALGKLSVYRTLNDDRKVPVPLFIIFSYLDEDYPTKCYRIIPDNKEAKDFFTKYNISLDGIWLSLKGFSVFQHELRNQKWDGNQKINDKDIKNILDIDENAPLRYGMRLKDLSNDIEKYYVPAIKVK